uniref:Ras-related protein Rab-43 n=1 Tax=Clastoptera arizonana TaxID=38151 RepID=A0A1B6D0L9_9HEMI
MGDQEQMPTFKCVLVGDGGTGKTTFVKRHLTGEFEKKYVATLGVEVHPLVFHTNRGPIRFNVWDTAGQERFRTITQSYYRSANGVIIVYDITKRSSFLNLQRWIEEVRRYTASNVLLVLVGNKCDLETLREVEFAEAEAMCEYIPEVMYAMEASAKENTNVEHAFLCLATELKRRHDHNAYVESSSTGAVKLSDSRAVHRCSSCSSL